MTMPGSLAGRERASNHHLFSVGLRERLPWHVQKRNLRPQILIRSGEKEEFSGAMSMDLSEAYNVTGLVVGPLQKGIRGADRGG